MKVCALLLLMPFAAADHNMSNGSNGSNHSAAAVVSEWMAEGIWNFTSPGCKQRVLELELACEMDAQCYGRCQNFTAAITGVCTEHDLYQGVPIFEEMAEMDARCGPCMQRYEELSAISPMCFEEVCSPSPSEGCRHLYSALEGECKNNSATIKLDDAGLEVLFRDFLQAKPWCRKSPGRCGKMSADLAREIKAIPCRSGFGH